MNPIILDDMCTCFVFFVFVEKGKEGRTSDYFYACVHMCELISLLDVFICKI